ncbi:ISAs1 family transposase [Adhaeretor mobilis]|uniref:Transposase DDE domain protein n=2 Tax=Adhaeretor mobilis TaxID=1930276 RepID=A0A517MWM4_9BACT|nr:ISAs1 family transposase [Adhaeretor mobilis]QDS97127.1 Transposase DDE domain protein [Adhaeretor mobilis]QDS99283.1 Transposase DDE domain protein [Adhaeretor mobilis]
MAITKSPVILTHFEELTDPRMERTKRHRLSDIVAIALCGAICGADSWADVERFGNEKIDWFRTWLPLEHGIPSHDTLGRVFSLLDTKEFYHCLANWVASLQLDLQGQTVAIDGKTLRRSFDQASGTGALHLVNAWASDLHLSLGQLATEQKSNEITAVPRLLEILAIEGAVVTLDAMHCQKQTAEKIRLAGADYVLQVKGNQKKMHEQLLQLFIDYGDQDYRGVRRHVTVEKNHGRDERREYYVAPAPPKLSEQWRDLRSVGMVFRYRKSGEKLSEETSFFISSLPPKVRSLAGHVRNHWSVENSLHWSLDVTFSEDQSRLRKGNGQEIAAGMRRLALSILKRDTTLKESLRGKRLRAGWNNQTLQAILTSIQA